MWTDAGVRILFANFPPEGCTIGLFTVGAGQPEMVATRGAYRRQMAGERWQARQESGVWMLIGPEVVFTGFVSRAAAIGWLLMRGGLVLCAAPFTDSTPRTLLDESDRLIVTPEVRIMLEGVR